MRVFQCNSCHFRNMKEQDPWSSNHLSHCNGKSADFCFGEGLHLGLQTTCSSCSALFGQCKKHVWRAEKQQVLPTSRASSVRRCLWSVCCLRHTLEHSLNPGVDETNVEFGAIRKTQKDTKCSHKLLKRCHRQTHRVGFCGGVKAPHCVACDGVHCFQDGCHSRTGNDVSPDKAVSIKLLLELQKLCDVRLFESRSKENVLKLCLHAMFHIVSFVRGFRGKELPALSLDAMAAHEQPSNPMLAHTMTALCRRMKGE